METMLVVADGCCGWRLVLAWLFVTNDDGSFEKALFSTNSSVWTHYSFDLDTLRKRLKQIRECFGCESDGLV